MKRLTLFLLAAVLCMLCACGEVWPEETGEATAEATQEITTAPLHELTMPEPITAPPPLPPREGAVMPPLQGGPMLYTFPAEEPYDIFEGEEEDYPVYYQGLVNDIGELVSQPQYTFVEYAHDDAGRVIGLFAYINKELTWYALDGTAQKMPFEAAWATAILNGRYWIVETLGEGRGGFSRDDGTCDGLYDTKEERFVFPPKDGLALRSYGDLVFGNQYETSSYDSKRLRGFQWNPADDSTREFPDKWRCFSYFPETGWYEMVEEYDRGGFDIYIVDQDMNIVPQLRTHWHIDERFDGGNYLVVRSRYGDGVETWVDRNGNFSELRYDNIQRRGNCYIAWSGGYAWSGTPTLLDGMLNILYEAQEGERLIHLSDDPRQKFSLVAFADEKGNIGKAWDVRTGREYDTRGKNGRWFGDSVYLLQNGRWQVIINPSDYLDESKGENTAWICLATEDGVIIQFAKEVEGWYTDTRHIALDWDGNPIDHPMLHRPFNSPAGEQGPRYYWVQDGTTRGYINEKGEWLFKHN